MFRYGTSGFRYNVDQMINMSEKLGYGIGALYKEMIQNADMPIKTAHTIGIGLMITASHNLAEDNGVKIVGWDGHIIDQKYEKFLEEIVNSVEFHQIQLKNLSKIKLIIGRDTRPSGIVIMRGIIKGIKMIGDCEIIDCGIMTTPQFHTTVREINMNQSTDQNYYVNLMRNLIIGNKINMDGLMIDCANGCGTLTMEKILTNEDETIYGGLDLIHTLTDIPNELNRNCGSDYLMNNPIEYHKQLIEMGKTDWGRLCGSFDGDADRLICWTYDLDRIYLMDGDHMILLILRYVLEILRQSNDRWTIGICCTGYSNGGMLNKVNQIANQDDQHMISVKIVPTGVKHLIKEAKNYDIGIYFEPNGHGSVLINRTDQIVELERLKDLSNQLVGDAIGLIIGIKYMLDEMGFSVWDMFRLYERLESKTYRLAVSDRNLYKTTWDGTKLLEPIEISQKIDTLLEQFKSHRAFLRPSGTENCLRLYVEGYDLDSVENLANMIKNIV
jgi:phosphoacetylglucosamine mutase